MMKKMMILLGMLLVTGSMSFAATSTSNMAVSLTIVDTAQMSSALATDPQSYQAGVVMHVLTDAGDGQKVSIYLNNTKVADAISDGGVVTMQVTEPLLKVSSVHLNFKVGNRELHVLQSVTEMNSSVGPQMKLSPDITETQIPVTQEDGTKVYRTVRSQVLLVEF